MHFSITRIDVSTLSSMLESPHPSFYDTYSLFYLMDAKYCASSSISLSFGPFVWVPPLSILRMIQKYYKEDSSDFCCKTWFWNVSSFFWGTLIFSFIYAYLMVSASNIPKYLQFSLSQSDLILSWFGISVPYIFVLFFYAIICWYWHIN